MRETEKVEKIETTEEEIIYCDQCTAECTDSFEVVPMELCESCNPEKGISVSEYFDKFNKNAEDEKNLTIGAFIIIFISFPFSFLLAGLDALDGFEYGKMYVAGAISALIWVTVLFVLI